MGFGIKIAGVLLILIILSLSGCIGNDYADNSSNANDDKVPVIIDRENLNDSMVIGGWIQTEQNYKLIFFSNYTFVQINDEVSYANGTWRIENGTMLVLTMETYDYSSSLFGEYLGDEDVSFGTVKNGVLSFSSINENVFRGFPAGDFVPEARAGMSEAISKLNSSVLSGDWERTGTNAKLSFLPNNTFVFNANGQTLNGTWKIEYDNILILTMDTYMRREYSGKEDVSYGVLRGNVLTFTSINEDFTQGFPAGNFSHI